MEKPHKHKNLFLKFLPKAASVVSFQNPPFSPGRDHHHHHRAHAHKGFSGPINFAVLPDEAREKPKNGGYASQEPTSPKVSCMGQIKYKHKKKKLVKPSHDHHHHHNHDHHNHDDDKVESVKYKEVKKSSTMMSKFFTSMRSPKKPADEDHHQTKKKKKSSSSSSNGSRAKEHGKLSRGATQDNNNKMMKVPGLGQMRKFASGRDTLGNFDWTAQIAPVDHDRDCFSDEERRRDSDDEDEEEREIIIPFSAPILVGGGGRGLSLEPRKEVNLWKRRTMAPPPPLALK